MGIKLGEVKNIGSTKQFVYIHTEDDKPMYVMTGEGFSPGGVEYIKSYGVHRCC